MVKHYPLVGAVSGLLLCTSCAVHVHGISTLELHNVGAHSVEAFHEHATLDDVRGGTGADPSARESRDRDRTGARFLWGNGPVQSFAQVYHVDWTDGADPNNRFEGIGFGVGLGGTPVIRYAPGGVHWILPWEAGLNFEDAANTGSNPTRGNLNPFEYNMQLGVGVDWRGLRPTVGVAYSRLVGSFRPSGGASSDDNESLRASNFGAYAELEYQPRGSRVYGNVRYQAWEYDAFSVGLGLRF